MFLASMEVSFLEKSDVYGKVNAVAVYNRRRLDLFQRLVVSAGSSQKIPYSALKG
jgi:hypothetical protein